ncbi:MAG: ankyrin repeat domain-containing protein [Micavibrio sp.]|nr:MAG: ankyrin repeat domain-containing protein [Micavibrio sp.]
MFRKIREAFRKSAERSQAHKDLLRAISDHDYRGVEEICKTSDAIDLNAHSYAIHAINHGTPKILKILLEHGADPNKWGMSIATNFIVNPAGEAVLGSRPEMLDVLLQDDRIESPDTAHVWRYADGLGGVCATPLDLARKRGEAECVELIERHLLQKYKAKYEPDAGAAQKHKKPSI